MAPSAPLSPVTVVAKPESRHWTFEEDQKLLAAIHLRGTVLDRAGKTVIGSWNAVAAEMGFADIAKGARRCSRRWFAMHPSIHGDDRGHNTGETGDQLNARRR